MTQSVAGSVLALVVIGCAGSAQAQESKIGSKQPLTPIDCPLHKAGIDPTTLKSIEDVEKYIQFLERPDRANWQKPDEVVKALGLKGSETVVDLGSGSGYFTFRLATVLPNGKVIAADTQPEMIRHIHRKTMSESISNVEPRIAKSDEPGVPRNADLIFICDVLHHVSNRSAWLKKLYSQMASGARVAIIEFKSGKLPEGPPESIKIAKADLIDLVRGSGFNLKDDRARLLPYQEFLVFVKP